VGEWYDTISLPVNAQPCVVRFRTIGYGGATVIHCHLLPHEDAGAMIWFDVANGPGIPTTNPSTSEVTCGF